MTCYRCIKCEVELCIGQHNESNGLECPSCQGPMKVLNSKEF